MWVMQSQGYDSRKVFLAMDGPSGGALETFSADIAVRPTRNVTG